MINKDIVVSILIPVYNGAKYIEKTIKSLLDQTYSNYEVIFIDDSSSDESLSILRQYEKEDSRIKVYTKPNGGNAVKSLMYGLPLASGKYMFYSSQDDLYSSDLLEKMVEKALSTGADAVIPEMIWYNDTDNTDERLVGIKGNKNIVLTGVEACGLSLDWEIHGFSLRNMELVRKIGYDDFAMNSDEYITRKFYLSCNKVVFSDGEFFYRQDNIDAITKSLTVKTFEVSITNIKLLNLLDEHNLNNEFKYYLLKSLRGIIGKYVLLLSNCVKLGVKGSYKSASILYRTTNKLVVIIINKKLFIFCVINFFNKKHLLPSTLLEK
ncbi:glycosyltransferase family 2 protein [Shewanella vesiculosa]|uniref:glycosyltransferase family 2 protein n=1 Tax=Shewanella vesiculosa TaxID=518738 RepID=UPI003850ADD7